jgi:hypothetical protein
LFENKKHLFLGNDRQNQDLGEDENRALHDDDSRQSNNSDENNNNQADDDVNRPRGIHINLFE